jgi:hypothetical protein
MRPDDPVTSILFMGNTEGWGNVTWADRYSTVRIGAATRKTWKFVSAAAADLLGSELPR